MAIKVGVRFKPATYRSSQETINEGLSADPPAGLAVRIIQLIAYDDTKVTTPGNPYLPGNHATESLLYILDERVHRGDLVAIAGMNQTQANAFWANELAVAKAFWAPLQAALVKSEIGVQLAAPSLY